MNREGNESELEGLAGCGLGLWEIRKQQISPTLEASRPTRIQGAPCRAKLVDRVLIRAVRALS